MDALISNTLVHTELPPKHRSTLFDNVKILHNGQREALDAVKEWGRNLQENIRNRNDLVLVGPAGVGKDYLAAALLNQLTLKFRNARHHFRYIDGIDLRNDLMEAKTSDFASYPARIAHYAGYHLLYVSDPFPQKAQLSDFERGAIFDVLEKRQHTGCNIFTCNATDYAQLCDQIGEANASRIFDGATVVPCDWQSFRQPTLFVECN